MNKAELVEAVAEKAELSKRDAEAAVDAVLEVIEAADPSNQKKIKIPASNTVAFKVSKAFKEKLN